MKDCMCRVLRVCTLCFNDCNRPLSFELRFICFCFSADNNRVLVVMVFIWVNHRFFSNSHLCWFVLPVWTTSSYNVLLIIIPSTNLLLPPVFSHGSASFTAMNKRTLPWKSVLCECSYWCVIFVELKVNYIIQVLLLSKQYSEYAQKKCWWFSSGSFT